MLLCDHLNVNYCQDIQNVILVCMQNCNQLLTKKEADRMERCRFSIERVRKIKKCKKSCRISSVRPSTCTYLCDYFSDIILVTLHFPGGKGRNLNNRGVHLRLVTGGLTKSKRCLDLQELRDSILLVSNFII